MISMTTTDDDDNDDENKKTNKQDNQVRAMPIQNFKLPSLVIFFLTFFFFAIRNRLVANKGNQNMKSKTETQKGKIGKKKTKKETEDAR